MYAKVRSNIMTLSRRDILKATSLALGTLALPSWVYSADLTSAPMPEVDKNKLADAALALTKKLGAEYADIRINKYRIESISTRERQIQNVSRGQNFGFGVRVLVKGTWGFSASPLLTAAEVERVTREAVEIARANSAFQTKPIRLASAPKVSGNWKSSFERDPFDVPVDDKIEFLMKLNEAALSTSGVSF